MDKWLLPGGNYNRTLYAKPARSRLTGPTGHSIKVWHTANRSLGWENKMTLAAPLWDSACLANLWKSKGFDKWDMIGISHIGDLWEGGEVKSFMDLQGQYNLAPSEIFRYTQARHALYSCFPRGSCPLASSPLEDRILDGHLPEKTISLIHRKLICNMEDPLQTLRTKWVADGIELDDEDWQEAVSSPRMVAIPARLRLVQLKILHRVYITGPRLVRMGRAYKGECCRGCGQEGSFLHILWECEYIQQYWTAIHRVLHRVLAVDLLPEARRCLLNVWEPTDLNTHHTQWATLGFMVDKRNIAKAWGAVTPPSLQEWKTNMDWNTYREKAVYVTRGCPNKWSRIWTPWNVYRGNICTSPQEGDLEDLPTP